MVLFVHFIHLCIISTCKMEEVSTYSRDIRVSICQDLLLNNIYWSYLLIREITCPATLNIFCRSITALGYGKKKLENFRRHMYIEKRIWSFPSIHQQLLTQKCQKWQISANVAFCAYSRFHMDTGAYGPTFYQKSSEIFQCLQFAWQWWASDTLFAMLKLSVS